MKLLFKREQTTGKVDRVQFKLWGKLELDADEQAIIKRYRFDEAILIEALQPTLIRNTITLGVVAFVLAFGFFNTVPHPSISFVPAIAARAANGNAAPKRNVGPIKI